MLAFYLTNMVSGGSLASEAASSSSIESKIQITIGIGLCLVFMATGIYVLF